MVAERYAELPREVRAFLENIQPHEVGQIQDAIEFYSTLTPHAKKFLFHSKPETLSWLTDARKEEVDQWVSAARLASASSTIGKFLVWAIVTIAGALMAGATIWNFFKGKD